MGRHKIDREQELRRLFREEYIVLKNVTQQEGETHIWQKYQDKIIKQGWQDKWKAELASLNYFIVLPNSVVKTKLENKSKKSRSK